MVESTALEMRRTGNRTVGSNPTLSAIPKTLVLLDLRMAPNARKCAIVTELDDCRGAPQGHRSSESVHIWRQFRQYGLSS